jgi:hypothetical protein
VSPRTRTNNASPPTRSNVSGEAASVDTVVCGLDRTVLLAFGCGGVIRFVVLAGGFLTGAVRA